MRLARRIDEDVRRLQVAVHDQACMRMRHRARHMNDKLDARTHAQAVRIGVAVDRLAIDVLKCQVGPAFPGQAGVLQARDVRVRQ